MSLIEFRSVILQWWNKFSGQLNLFNELISDSNYISFHYIKIHCNEDIYAEKIEGTRENSILYVIGDNLYSKERFHQDLIITRCVHFKIAKSHCKARANIAQESLLVISRTGDHTCAQDPLQRIQIMMESKMKMLAATSGDNPVDSLALILLLDKYPPD